MDEQSNLYPQEPTPQPKRRRRPSHEEIMKKINAQTYPTRAIAEVIGDRKSHFRPETWTAEERAEVAKRQAAYRRQLGIPEPKWDTSIRESARPPSPEDVYDKGVF